MTGVARRAAPLVGLAMLSVVFSVTGCGPDARYRVASRLFDGVPAPGTDAGARAVVRAPRRLPPAVASPPAPPATMEQPGAPEDATFVPALADVQRLLPRDAAGGIDWVRALEDKVIEPKPGIGAGAKEQPTFPLVIERVPPGQPAFTATFPHKAHTAWLACANCHPAIFQMRRGAAPINMAAIYRGEFCGRCHGKVSFAVPTGCPRCHLALVKRG